MTVGNNVLFVTQELKTIRRYCFSPNHQLWRRSLCLVLVIWFASAHAMAESVRVAVASNAKSLLSSLAVAFTGESGHEVVISAGSTGKLTAQIMHGAPYDVFFAADAERPQRLEAEGFIVPGTRFSYAIGELVLWDRSGKLLSSSAPMIPPNTEMVSGVLIHPTVQHVAIGNPPLSPYGAAAQEVLSLLGLVSIVGDQLVRGENIGQTYQFIHTGNAEVGFVARAQMVAKPDVPGVWQVIPDDWHAPIDQQAVQLTDAPAASAFMVFVQSDKARAMIANAGYRLP